jgi:peptide/nickel transport system substrate-binding protein
VFNWGDPVIGVHRTCLTRNSRKGVVWSNTQSYSNPKVDALIETAAARLTRPGLGRLTYESILRHDSPTLLGSL